RRQTMFVFDFLVDLHVIFVVRQNLAKATDAHRPSAGRRDFFFELLANAEFLHHTRPALATGTSLIAKSANVVAIIFSDVAITRNVYSVGSSSGVVHVFITFHLRGSADT